MPWGRTNLKSSKWRISNSRLYALIAIVPVLAIAQEGYSPYTGKNYPVNVYWGDTHLHTRISVDSGNALSPDEAYRFARGEAVTASNGMQAKLHRPLDFLVIADHAEYMGLRVWLDAADPSLLHTETGRRWSRYWRGNAEQQARFSKELSESWLANTAAFRDRAFEDSVWSQVTATADRYNQPGKFTAFIGYEWSSMEGGNNLHRVVIFKGGKEKVKQILPFSSFDSRDPADLWAFLADYERKTGDEVLAIPHNGNLSNGSMFSLRDYQGRALDRAHVETRSRWEPLYEVTQIKGDGETHPLLSPTDEFADYERWDDANVMWMQRNERWMLEYEYARSALKLGLQQEAKLGVNPFKFGLIGSTDTHTGLSAADENNFWGKGVTSEPSRQRLTHPLKWVQGELAKDNALYGRPIGWEFAAAGYAAVWATDNEREALFAAMKRKETYATTGPRITVRFFGGWDYAPEDAVRADLALIGYRKGVPMGGDLISAPPGKAPNFLVGAVKDPDGANLDRVQVIKGWRDEKGEQHERIYNVALSDGRKEHKNGKTAPLGNTVDVKNATYTNTIGDPELAVMWEDPDFDPEELAFYYVRVLEIPTPRWTAYDAKFFGIKDIPPEVPMVTQERAYTSPIWYTPTPNPTSRIRSRF